MRDYHEFKNCFADELLQSLRPHIFYCFKVVKANYYVKDNAKYDLMKLDLKTTDTIDGREYDKTITVWQSLPKNNDNPKFTQFVKYFLKDLGLNVNQNLMWTYDKIPSLEGKTINAEIEVKVYNGQLSYNLININKGETL